LADLMSGKARAIDGISGLKCDGVVVESLALKVRPGRHGVGLRVEALLFNETARDLWVRLSLRLVVDNGAVSDNILPLFIAEDRSYESASATLSLSHLSASSRSMVKLQV